MKEGDFLGGLFVTSGYGGTISMACQGVTCFDPLSKGRDFFRDMTPVAPESNDCFNMSVA